MEGRTPQGRTRGTRASVKRPARGWMIAAAMVAVLVFVLLFGLARNNGDDALDLYSQTPQDTPAAPAAVAPAAPPAAAGSGAEAGAAIIVDAGAGSADDASATPAVALPPTASPDTPPPSAAAPTPAATAHVRASPRRQSAAKQKPSSEEDLLGTLLGIIKEEPGNTMKHESMDSLIARIRAEDQRNAAGANAAFDSIDRSRAGSAASTGSGIQAQLRRCPNANTLRGIDCRRRICLAHAGKDPACPAR